MEADEVAIEQAVHDLGAPGQHVEHVRARKRRVVKEGDLQRRLDLPQVLRHQPEIIVMHPDQRVILGLRGGGLGEQPVHLAERVPVGILVAEQPGKGMQDRPQCLFRGHMVEALHLLRRQRQPGNRIVAIAVRYPDDAVELLLLLRRHLLPGNPGAAPLGNPAEEALQGRHDAVRALVLPIDPPTAFHRLLIGLAVIDDDEIRFAHEIFSPSIAFGCMRK